MRYLVAFIAFIGCVFSAPLDEDFGYVDVRPGAHMFWVVYHTEATENWADSPLILWLQGGPGTSGVSYGNFMEVGPYNADQSLRPTRWTMKSNLMFVDNPVGVGYSYVDDLSLLATNNTQIGDDLGVLLKQVFMEHQEMQLMPFYIYAEMEAVKMATAAASSLAMAIQEGEITCDFRGISLGSPWISPGDSVTTWGSYLYNMGFLNSQELANVDEEAIVTQEAIDAENRELANAAYGSTQAAILVETGNMNFYNIHGSDYDYVIDPEVQSLISGPLKVQWDVPQDVEVGAQNTAVQNALAEEFMKPVVDDVIRILEEGEIMVTIYNGNMGLISDIIGTYKWIEEMQWSGKESFDSAERVSMTNSNNITIGYYQRDKNFAVISYLRTGDLVNMDNPEGGLQMVDLNIVWTSDILS